MNENSLRDQIVQIGRSIFERGLTFGSTGNISARTENGWLMTPTGSSLGNLDPEKIAKLDQHGRHISGDPPNKRVFFAHGVL